MARNNKTNMEILNEIREYRNRENKDNSVFVIKVENLGIGGISGKNIYRLIEEKNIDSIGNGEFQKEISERFYVYDKEPKLIAMRNPQTIENSQTESGIVPIGFEGNEQENWGSYKEEIEQCLEEREREVKALAKLLGIDESDIDSLSEIDLSQKIADKELENLEDKESNEDEPQQIDEKKMEKVGITGMNEVNLQSQVDTKGTSLGKVLSLEGYTKILVVHSYKLAQLTNSDGEKGKVGRMPFGIIAQKADGTFETIPETKLRPYRGSNTEVTEIDNAEEVRVSNEECMFEVPGTDKKLIVDQKDPYGIPDVYFSKTTHENDGNMAAKVQDKYAGTERQDVEVRALFNANRGQYQADNSHDELKGHTKVDCDEIGFKDVDGYKDTSTHTHNHTITEGDHLLYNGKSMTPEEIAAKTRFKISTEEFVEKFNRIAKQQGKNFNIEQVYDEIEKEVNRELRDPNLRR